MPWLPFEWDVNNDGNLTVTDIGLWLEHAFFLPGDWVIWASLRYWPELGRFFEVDARAYGSTFSALISVFVWLAIIVVIMTTSHALAELDRAMTRSLRLVLGSIAIKLRIARRLIVEGIRAKRVELRAAMHSNPGPELSAEELRVLKAHAYLEPPATLALSDLVRATGVPRSQITPILERLQSLDLLDSPEGVSQAERAYALTKPGRDLVAFDRLSTGRI
jgi:DNA-binding MarR family transcriptional regulator